MTGDGDPMEDQILTPSNCSSNVSHATKFRDAKDLSIIVTERFLADLGYAPNSSHVFMQVPVYDTTTSAMINLKVPIQVKAIVKEIPGKVEFMYTNFFLQQYLQMVECTFDYRTKKEMLLYFEGSKQDGNKLRTAIQNFFDHHPQFKAHSPTVDLADDLKDYSFNPGYVLTMSVYPFETYLFYDTIFNEIAREPELKTYIDNGTLYRIYDYYNFNQSNQPPIRFDFLSILRDEPARIEWH